MTQPATTARLIRFRHSFFVVDENNQPISQRWDEKQMDEVVSRASDRVREATEQGEDPNAVDLALIAYRDGHSESLIHATRRTTDAKYYG